MRLLYINAKNKNIYVIDSKNNSVTEGLIVMKAIELIGKTVIPLVKKGTRNWRG